MTTPTGTSVSTLIGRIDTTNRIDAPTAPTVAATRRGVSVVATLAEHKPRRHRARIPAKLPRVLIMPKIDPTIWALNSRRCSFFATSLHSLCASLRGFLSSHPTAVAIA